MCCSNWAKRPLCQVIWHSLWALYKQQLVTYSPTIAMVYDTLAISRATLNSGLLMEHMFCHMFPPAHVFLSSLGNIPITKIGGSPFPHRGAILNVGRCPGSSVVCDPTACDDDASIAGICSSTSTDILASSGKKPLQLKEGGKAWPFFPFWLDLLDLLDVFSDSESERLNGSPQSIGVLLSCKCRTASPLWRLTCLASC